MDQMVMERENYRSWKLRMKTILEEQNLWQYVITDPRNTVDWRLGDQKAMETIIMHTKASYIKYIVNGKSAREVWLKLENTFDPPMFRMTRSNTMSLEGKFSPVQPHKNKFMQELEGILDSRGGHNTTPRKVSETSSITSPAPMKIPPKPSVTLQRPQTSRIPPKVPQKPTIKPKSIETKNSLSRVEVVREFLALKMHDEQDIRDYCRAFMDKAEMVKRFKDLITEDMISVVFLASLPKSFENFVKSIEQKEQMPSIYTLQSIIMKNKDRKLASPLEQVNIFVSSTEWSVSLGGAHYFVLFTDAFTRKIFVYFMKSREEFMSKFLIFKSKAEKHTKRKIKSICGKRIENDKFKRFLEEHNIKVIVSLETDEENLKIKEIAKRMLSNSNLNNTLWAEAVNTAVYLKNRIPLQDHGMKTPYELWNGVIPKIAHIRKFGSTVLLLKSQFKLAFKLVGYENDSDEYRCYDPSSKKIIRTYRVTFLTNTPANEPESLMDNISRISSESSDLGEYFLYQEYDNSIYDEVDSDSGYIQPVKCECTSGVCKVHVFVDYIDFAEC